MSALNNNANPSDAANQRSTSPQTGVPQNVGNDQPSTFNSASSARQLYDQLGSSSAPNSHYLATSRSAITIPITINQVKNFKAPSGSSLQSIIASSPTGRGPPANSNQQVAGNTGPSFAPQQAIPPGALSTADPGYSFLATPNSNQAGGFINPLALPNNCGVFYGDTIYILESELEKDDPSVKNSSRAPMTAHGQHLYVQVPHGVGIALLRDGSRYGGEWNRGHYHGQGALACAAFDYQGSWDMDRMHGYGMMRYSDSGSGDSSGSYLTPTGATIHGGSGSALGNLLSSGANLPVVGLVIRGVTFFSPFEDTHKPLEYIGEFNRIHHRHGKGMMKYRNGDVYDGDWASNRRQGKGRLLTSNGEMYEGEWSNDERNGYGIIQYVNGATFKGMVVKDQRHGEGIMRFANGDEFFGNFTNDDIQGHGVMRYRNGDVYEGEWRDGVRHGMGKYTLKKRGTVVRGCFVNGLMQGEGTVEFPGVSTFVGDFDKGERRSGTITVYKEGGKELEYCYQGQWVGESMTGKGLMWYGNGDFSVCRWIKNKREGPGCVRYANGSEFCGTFLDDKRQGNGVLQTADGSVMIGRWVNDTFAEGYEGEWDGQTLNGIGNMRFANGDHFVGLFLRGKRHGPGILRIKAGSHVVLGKWVEDLLSCEIGTWNLGTGEVYVGGFRNGYRDGRKGTMWLTDGSVFSGEWRYGVPMGPGVFFGTNVDAPQYKILPPMPGTPEADAALPDGEYGANAPGADEQNADTMPADTKSSSSGGGGGFGFLSNLLWWRKSNDDDSDGKAKRLFTGFNPRFTISTQWAYGQVSLMALVSALHTQYEKEKTATATCLVIDKRGQVVSQKNSSSRGSPAQFKTADPTAMVPVGRLNGRGTIFYPNGVIFRGEWSNNAQKLVVPHRKRAETSAAQLRRTVPDSSQNQDAGEKIGLPSAAGAPSMLSTLYGSGETTRQIALGVSGPTSTEPAARAYETNTPSPPPPDATANISEAGKKAAAVDVFLPATPSPCLPPGTTAYKDTPEPQQLERPLSKGPRVCTFCTQEFGFFRKETACALCSRCSCAYCLHAIETNSSPSLYALVQSDAEAARNKTTLKSSTEPEDLLDVAAHSQPPQPPPPVPSEIMICASCGRVVLENITQGILWIPGKVQASNATTGKALHVDAQPGTGAEVEAAPQTLRSPSAVYRGYLSRDLPHIHGILWLGKNTCYVGGFHCGAMHGKGTQYFSNGEKYVGEWASNKRHGRGTYCCNDGSSYQGEWKSGKLVQLWYHGEVDEQMRRHGRGQSIDENEAMYNGEWQRDTRQGTGILQFKNGVVYSGDFCLGRIEGEGKLVHNTSVFYGTFIEGKKNGRGTERFGECVIEGEWKADVLSGPVRIFDGLVEEIYETTYANGNERDDCFLPPPMKEDEDATHCTGCKSAFSFFLRRHHCRLCGHVFCDRCTTLRSMMPPHFNLEGPQRVCTPCYRAVERRRMFAVRWYNTGHMYAGCWSQGKWEGRGLYQRPDGTCIVFNEEGGPVGWDKKTDPNAIREASATAEKRLLAVPDSKPPSPRHIVDTFVLWWKQMQKACKLYVELDLNKLPSRLAKAQKGSVKSSSTSDLLSNLDTLEPLFLFPKIPQMRPLKLFTTKDGPNDESASIREARFMPSLMPSCPYPPLEEKPEGPPPPCEGGLTEHAVMDEMKHVRLTTFMSVPPPSEMNDKGESVSHEMNDATTAGTASVILACYNRKLLFPSTPSRPQEGTNKLVPWSDWTVPPTPQYSSRAPEVFENTCPFWRPDDFTAGEKVDIDSLLRCPDAASPSQGNGSAGENSPSNPFEGSGNAMSNDMWTPVTLDGPFTFTTRPQWSNAMHVTQTEVKLAP